MELGEQPVGTAGQPDTGDSGSAIGREGIAQLETERPVAESVAPAERTAERVEKSQSTRDATRAVAVRVSEHQESEAPDSKGPELSTVVQKLLPRPNSFKIAPTRHFYSLIVFIHQISKKTA